MTENRKVKFYKYEATGNDFILFDAIDAEITLSEGFIQKACERRTGIGADGILLVLPSDTGDAKMRIFNPDGSEAEMCGNGARALALHMLRSRRDASGEIYIETQAGIRKATISKRAKENIISITMGSPGLKRGDIPVDGEMEDNALDIPVTLQSGATVKGTCVSFGNPHCVLFVEDVSDYPVETVGPEIETHRMFPNKTNVEFIEIINPRRMLFRVWERGVGETLACGTGTCAAAVAAHIKGKTDTVVTVSTRGGDLEVDCSSKEIVLTGPANLVFEGVIKA
ncbi:MAG: diaminopimelate epimerase [Actinobacteria bacterium]|nr:diaminopimelate epimerase [Actinomycetota bacterium]